VPRGQCSKVPSAAVVHSYVQLTNKSSGLLQLLETFSRRPWRWQKSLRDVVYSANTNMIHV